MIRQLAIALVVTALLTATEDLITQSFAEDFSIWPVDLRINGTVLTCTGPEIEPTIVTTFFRNGGGNGGKFVVVWLDQGFDVKPFESLLDPPKDRQLDIAKFGEEHPLSKFKHTEFQALNESLSKASGVLLFSSRALKKDTTDWLGKSSSHLHRVIANGGAVCGVGPVVSHFGEHQHESFPDFNTMATGLNLIPDAIVYGGYIDKLDRTVMNTGVTQEPL